MKQTIEASIKEQAEDEIAFDQKISSLKAKYKDFLTDDIIKHYSNKHGLTRDEAILKLCANFSKEENDTSSKQIALKAIGGFRMMSPKLHGVELRQSSLDHQVVSLEKKIETINEKLLELTQYIKELKEPKELSKKTWISNILNLCRKIN